MNPYLWQTFSPMTGTFDYVRTPIFKREPVNLPVQLTLEYRFSKWQDGVPQIQLYAVGRIVTDLRVEKDGNAEWRLRTIGGDYLISADKSDPSAARIVPAASAPVMVSRFIRLKLAIDANSRASSCEVLESDAPIQLQEKACEVLKRTAKFTVSSATIEQTVRFQLPADQWPKEANPGGAATGQVEQPVPGSSP